MLTYALRPHDPAPAFDLGPRHPHCRRHSLLNRLRDDNRLHYEPPLIATKKSIDFMIEAKDGSRSWIDFRTVEPAWQDDDASWRRFEAIAAAFPKNASLVVDRAFGGAGISGQLAKSRWSFIQRTIQAEERAALLQDVERGPVRLMLCSTGFAWRLDHLEDFADFYRYGRARQDDWAGNAVARYMSDAGIALSRNLAGFSYIERKHDQISASRLVFDVCGPNMGR